MSNKSIDSLYFLKGVCAFLVVCCHAPMFGVFNDWIAPLKASAVPFFFVISGYFLYNEKKDKERERLKKTILKLVPIILVCNLSYLLWFLPTRGFNISSWQQALDLIFYGDTTSGHLWYLTAFIWALLFFYLISFVNVSRTYTLSASLSLVLVNLLGGAYAHFLNLHFSVLTAIAHAIPFLAMGMLIRRYKTKCLSSIFASKTFLIISSFLLIIEFLIVSHFAGYYITRVFVFTLLFVPSVFLNLLKQQDKSFFTGSGRWITNIGKTYSGNIYYWHMLVINIVLRIFILCSIPLTIYNQIAAPLCFAIALIASIIIVKIQDRLGWNILR